MKKLFTFALLILGGVSAQADKTIYMYSTGEWNDNNPKFGVYAWGNDIDGAWFELSAIGTDGVYTATLDDAYTGMVFGRFDPSKEIAWDNEWNKSDDLTVTGNAVYYFTGWNSEKGSFSEIAESTYVIGGQGEIGGLEFNPWNPNLIMQTIDHVNYTYTLSGSNVYGSGNKTWRVYYKDSWTGLTEDLTENIASGVWDLTFNVNIVTKAHSVNATKVGSFYTVTGVEGLDLGEWGFNERNNMTDNGDNTYTLTKKNIRLATGNYAFKAVKDWSWGTFYGDESGNDAILAITNNGVYNVTFTLTLTNDKGVITAVAATPTFTLVGVSALTGSSNGWLIKNDDYHNLVSNGDGTFSITKNYTNLSNGSYEYKIVSNHEWGNNGEYGKIEGESVNNAVLNNISAGGNYIITYTLNPWNKTIDVVVKEGKVMTLSSEYEYTTFASEYALNWENVNGVKAYFATVSNGKVVLKKFEGTAPVGIGLLLKRTGGDVVDPIIANANGNAPANNKLVGVTDATTVGEGNNYVLSTKNGETGFYRLVSNVTIPAGRAYLHTDAALATVDPGSEARVAWVFEDEDNTTTGIEAVSTAAKAEGIFNLSGQRVAQPQKGLYIVNGKKVVMK